MYPSSSSSSPGISNSEMPKTGGVKRDAGSGGTIPVNGAAVYPGTPKSSVPSFAAVVSSSSASGKTNSPFCSSTKPSSSTALRQKHPQPPASSAPCHPLGDNSNDNNFINSTTFTTGSAINTSAQSTMASSSSAASPPSCMRNSPDGDTPGLDNNNDEVENDQEDSESSDVEIYLNSFDSNTSTTCMKVLSGTNSAYSPGATSSKGNQMPIPAYLDSQSPFDLPTQTKTGYTPITEDQGTCGHQGPDQVSVLGTYENGYINAHPINPDSNDRTHNSSHSAPSFVNDQIPSQQQWTQNVVHGHANPSTSSVSGSPGHPPLPDMKCATEIAALSPVDDSGNKIQSTRMPNPSSSITIDLANLSISGGHFGGSAPLTGSSLTAASAGSGYQGQMGMIVSGSQPAVNSVREGSTTPYSTLNGIFTSSASDPGLCGLTDGGNGSESAGSASENGTGSCTGVVKTPNVYINGLAPHFPEDELFNLCNEFGPIRSVRTFTRHAKDTESGYGFVLFEYIDDADKCINEIRKRYKNLHPTFSKQIHKIPGTNYAAGPSTSWDVSVTGDDIGANGGFKAKMESLQDPMSTNLYMEGLPLSIDEPTLTALVSPHQIVSSRFFQTRLSDPPKIIAFVRLETRAGAEEIIERLHGRMVRGWNDTGSRITVRFADTSKQRDLRERAAQETDTSPSRLTIAQASLLNLRGQDLRPSAKPMQPTHTGNTLSLPSSASSRGFSTSVSAPDFTSNVSFAHHGHSNFNLPIIGNGLGRTTPAPTIGGGHTAAPDYSLAFEGSALHPRSRSPYPREYLQPQVDQQHGIPGQHAIGRFRLGRETMSDSLRSDASVPYVDPMRGREDMLNEEIEENFYSQSSGMRFPRHQIHGLPYGQHRLPSSQSMDSMLGQTYSRPSPVYTRSGYTPAEEYIMRAHAESAALSQAHRQPNHVNYQPQRVERGRPLPLALGRPDADPASNIAVGMRAYRAQASLMSPTVSTSTSTNSLSSFGSAGELSIRDGRFGLPSAGISGMMTEEDFHARETMSSATLMTLKNLHASRLSRDLRSYHVGQKSGPLSPFLPASSSSMGQHQDHSPSLQDEASPVSMVSPSPNDTILSAYQQQSANAHMRSTTLPQHRPSGIANGRIRGHHQHSSMSIPKQNLGTPQHASVARLGGNSALVEESSGAIYECDTQDKRLSSSNTAHHGNVGSSVPLKTHYSSSAIFGDAEQSCSPLSASSSLISPTLTYASRTPSTLSPPTPFFGSFNSNMEGFDKNVAGDLQQQKEILGGNASRSD